MQFHGFCTVGLETVFSLPLSRAFPIRGPESPQENGIVSKSGILGSLQHRHVPPDSFRGLLQAFLPDVLVNGAAVNLLETVHQIVPAQEKGAS